MMTTRLAIAFAWVMAVGLALFLIAPLVVIAAASFSPTPSRANSVGALSRC